MMYGCDDIQRVLAEDRHTVIVNGGLSRRKDGADESWQALWV